MREFREQLAEARATRDPALIGAPERYQRRVTVGEHTIEPVGEFREGELECVFYFDRNDRILCFDEGYDPPKFTEAYRWIRPYDMTVVPSAGKDTGSIELAGKTVHDAGSEEPITSVAGDIPFGITAGCEVRLHSPKWAERTADLRDLHTEQHLRRRVHRGRDRDRGARPEASGPALAALRRRRCRRNSVVPRTHDACVTRSSWRSAIPVTGRSPRESRRSWACRRSARSFR